MNAQPMFHKRKAFDSSDMDEQRKKICQQQQQRCFVTKRMAELTLEDHLVKRVRSSTPKYRAAKASEAIERNQKSTYTKQEVEQLVKHLNDIHRAELDEQYVTFQTIVNDFMCSSVSEKTPSYIG